MTKLDLQTPDFVAANAARLAELFPTCVTETRQPDGTLKRAIDFDLLRQELSHDLVEGPQERYRLDWPGKREALALANAPIRKTLRPCKDESVDFETTRNLYIEGDNLDALKLLQETYLGKVKMIYIDPPYNTGNDFIYDDNFSISGEEHDLLSGTRDEEGNAMFQEEKWKQNSSASGRFHSEWLSMMYPRLKLARNLLSNDGAIFMSIDDSEVESLKRMAAEIFGESNFVGTIVWAAGRKNDSRYISKSHEYIICFARDLGTLKEKGISWQIRKKGLDAIYATYTRLRNLHGDDHTAVERGLRAWYAGLPDSDPSKRNKHYSSVDRRGIFFPSDLRKPQPTSRSRYDILHPSTGKPVNMHPNGWSFAPERMEVLLAQDRIKFGPDETTRPTLKVYLEEADLEAVYSVLYQDGRGASKRLTDLMNGRVFEFPKDETVLQMLVEMTTSQEDIILDFFSGSATTAHAVMQFNAEDGGKRRHIVVQLPEPCDEKSEASKAGFKTIAEIGKERIRRAGKKILEEWQAKQESSAGHLKLDAEHSVATAPDIGFRVLKIDSSNMADVYYQPDELTQDGLMLQVDNLRPGRKPEDLLFQVLLDWGVDLALPITEETILKRRVFFVAEDALAACFDTGLDEDFVKELAKRQPLRAVFRDSGYASDAVKINFEQIFKALSPHTELKTL
jgi:adenine-specific DNA-methyltransferase